MGKWRRRRERVHHQAQSSAIKEYRIDPSLECRPDGGAVVSACMQLECWPDGGALLRRRRGRCLRVCLILVILVLVLLVLLLVLLLLLPVVVLVLLVLLLLMHDG